MGSIPTRSRHRLLPLVLLLPLLLPGRVAGQDTTRVRPDTSQVLQDTTLVRPGLVVIQARPAQDTIRFPRPPVTPMGAFFRSLVLPGWSQSILNRRLTGGLFIATEGLAVGMTVKTIIELQYLDRTSDTTLARAKRQQRQDWITVIAFNHLFSALEAYVGAHLWDFPEDIRLRAVPLKGGGIGAAVTLPLRTR